MRMAWRPRARVGPPAVLGVAAFVCLSLLLLATVRFSPPPSTFKSPCFSDPLADQTDPEDLALYFTPRAKQVTEVVSTFLLEPRPELCSQSLDLLILVPSPPGASAVRDTIRKTWGSVVTSQWPGGETDGEATSWKVAVVFLLGTTGDSKRFDLSVLKSEALRHQDLLVGDFVDSYRNLTTKVLAGLNWASQRCRQASYVLKADQDSFVHVDRLLSLVAEVQRTQPVSNAVLGEMLCSEAVNRDPGSPVRVDASLYPFSTYPPYVRGGSYVLPGPLLTPLVNASRYMPRLPVEDAFINGVLARTLHVQHVNLPGVMKGLVCALSPCVFLATGQLTATNVDVTMMEDIWRAVKAGPQHCQQHSTLSTRVCVWIASHWN